MSTTETDPRPPTRATRKRCAHDCKLPFGQLETDDPRFPKPTQIVVFAKTTRWSAATTAKQVVSKPAEG
jgi:hypothetical protein